MGRLAGISLLGCLGAGCLGAPGAASDGGGSAEDGGAGSDGGMEPGTTAWQIPLGLSVPYVAVDQGELVVAAGFQGTIELESPVTASGGGNDLLVAGFSAEGAQRFAKVFGGEATEFPTAVSLSPVSGEVGVVGVYLLGDANLGGATMPEPVSLSNAFVARYGPTGQHLWSLPATASDGVAAGYSLSMSGSGALALSGDYSSELGLGALTAPHSGAAPDLYFARVSPSGVANVLVGYGASEDQIGAGALYDGLGSLYLFGTQTGAFAIDEFSPDSDDDGGMFVCQIDDLGTDATWLFDSVGGRVGSLRGVVAPDGSLVLTGWFEGTFAFDLPDQVLLTSRGGSDVFIALIGPDGSVRWVEQFGGIGDDEPRGIAVGPDGAFAVTGMFRAEASLGGGAATMTSKGGADVFLLAFSADRELRWAHGFGDLEDDVGFSVAVDTGGAVILGASYRGEVDFGGEEPLDSGGADAGVLVRFR